MPGLFQVGRRVMRLHILILMIRKTNRFLLIDQIQKVHSCLRQHLFFHHDATLVIEFALVPKGAVRQVMFAFQYPPFFNAGARGDPLVVGVDHRLELLVCENVVGHVSADTRDRCSDFTHGILKTNARPLSGRAKGHAVVNPDLYDQKNKGISYSLSNSKSA